MNNVKLPFRQYLSLILLFIPGVFFVSLFFTFRSHFNGIPWQFIALGIFGLVATVGGVMDWRFHRDPLKLKISKKERDAEAAALGFGGVPMFILMWLAMLSDKPTQYLIPILLLLLYTVVAICYDEFVFHIRRCGKTETLYHRMLVLGNGAAWFAWFHYIYCR